MAYVLYALNALEWLFAVYLDVLPVKESRHRKIKAKKTTTSTTTANKQEIKQNKTTIKYVKGKSELIRWREKNERKTNETKRGEKKISAQKKYQEERRAQHTAARSNQPGECAKMQKESNERSFDDMRS